MSPSGAAVVTGGASGIGEAVARRLAADGAAVAVLDRDAEGAARVASDIGGLALVADVGDSAALEEALERAAEQLGGLRWLVNNAGVGNLKPLEDYSDREVDLIWRVNVAGTFSGLRAAARLMRPGGGSIVNIASVSAIRPSPGTAAYGAAKAGLLNLTQSLAQEWGPDGIRVNAIIAGLMQTEAAGQTYGNAEAQAAVGRSMPLQRMGTGDDLAGAILWLCSDLAAWVSGARINVDGGGERPYFLDLVGE